MNDTTKPANTTADRDQTDEDILTNQVADEALEAAAAGAGGTQTKPQ